MQKREGGKREQGEMKREIREGIKGKKGRVEGGSDHRKGTTGDHELVEERGREKG